MKLILYKFTSTFPYLYDDLIEEILQIETYFVVVMMKNKNISNIYMEQKPSYNIRPSAISSLPHLYNWFIIFLFFLVYHRFFNCIYFVIN